MCLIFVYEVNAPGMSRAGALERHPFSQLPSGSKPAEPDRCILHDPSKQPALSISAYVYGMHHQYRISIIGILTIYLVIY